MTYYYKQGGPMYANLGWLGPAASGFAAWRQARETNRANQANLAAQQAAYNQAQKERAPVVEGAQDILSNTENFAPFVEGGRNIANQALTNAQSYGQNVSPYQEAGLEGVEAHRRLAGQQTPEATLGLAGKFFNPYTQATYDLGATDIADKATQQRKALAAQAAQGGTSQSAGAARRLAFAQAARDRELGRLGTEVGSRAFDRALQEARLTQQGQRASAQDLVNLGTTGLNQAVTSQNLGQAASQFGIQAPFLPFQQYGQTIGSVSGIPTPPTQQVRSSPVGAALGAGTQAYYNQRQG